VNRVTAFVAAAAILLAIPASAAVRSAAAAPALYRTYRLFEFDEEREASKYFVTEGPLDEHFTLEPIEFRARLKSVED
jgi:hypothetical protein